jgi:hypothetical protein
LEVSQSFLFVPHNFLSVEQVQPHTYLQGEFRGIHPYLTK